jgi:hypothetical protein
MVSTYKTSPFTVAVLYLTCSLSPSSFKTQEISREKWNVYCALHK